jgi:hypothetical protein
VDSKIAEFVSFARTKYIAGDLKQLISPIKGLELTTIFLYLLTLVPVNHKLTYINEK